MRDVLATTATVVLLALATGCAQSTEEDARSKIGDDRVHSSNGFSFLPPQGGDWTEEFGETEIMYLKQTDRRTVSFYAGALEGEIVSQVDTTEALVNFVRTKKDQWGAEGRYFDTSSSFRIDDAYRSCVRYELSANDRGATNVGNLDSLKMQVLGRFCVHPGDSTKAVDIYYSVRHPPSFNAAPYLAEGEKFLDSLQFTSLTEGSHQ